MKIGKTQSLQFFNISVCFPHSSLVLWIFAWDYCKASWVFHVAGFGSFGAKGLGVHMSELTTRWRNFSLWKFENQKVISPLQPLLKWIKESPLSLHKVKFNPSHCSWMTHESSRKHHLRHFKFAKSLVSKPERKKGHWIRKRSGMESAIWLEVTAMVA